MAKGRFCFPKTIEEEEFCLERALPKSTRYKNKWAVSVFKDWQWSRGWWSFKEYELDKVQLLTWPITEIDALMLSYWLSKFVQEVAKCSKDPYPPKTLYQIVCWKEPSHRVQSLGLFRQKGNCIELSSFLIRFVIFRQILDTEMKDGSWHWFESKTKRKSQTLMKKKGSISKVEYLEWRLRAKLRAKACRS